MQWRIVTVSSLTRTSLTRSRTIRALRETGPLPATSFDRAAARLSRAGIGLRVFVQLPAPFVPPARALESVLEAVHYAVDRGAGHVTLIPSRDGNGALDELREQGHWTRSAPELIEEAAEGCAGILGVVVTVDLWDSDRFLTCRHCRLARVARLRRFNDTGSPGPPVRCSACTSS